MAFPVTINGNTYTQAMFDDFGYITAFPNIFSDLAAVASGIATAAAAGGTFVGPVSMGSTLAVTGNVAINTNKFNITASNGNFSSAGIMSLLGASSAWNIDGSGLATISVTNGGHTSIGAGSGLVLVKENGGSECALYFVNYGTGTLISDPNATRWVAPTTSPGGGKASIASDGTTYCIYNNLGSTTTFTVLGIRIGPTA
jgi:hypothetical protein